MNLGLDDLDLGGELTARLGRTVRVDNDVNAAALGAFHLLEKQAGHSMAYLNLGTGLAAGIVLDGQLWRGSSGTAGEIGRQWPTDDPKPARAVRGLGGGIPVPRLDRAER